MGDAEHNKKLTLGLVVLVGLLAVVAIVISAVSLSKNMPPAITVNNPSASGGAPSGGQVQGQNGQQVIVQVPAPAGPMANSVQARYTPTMGTEGRIFSFYVDNDYGSYGYLDDQGYHSGFAVGLLDLVCEAAEMDCRLTWDLATNCWETSPGQRSVGGKGLHGRWYSGCMGWYTTIERTHVFQFAQPFLKPPAVRFLVLSTKTFDTSKENIQNAKIVFLASFASDEKCMARVTGAVPNPQNIIYAPTRQAAINLLSNGYDTIFVTQTTFILELQKSTLKTVGPVYSCMIAGPATMSRKDSDVSVHWNRGFAKLKNSGRFKKYCAEANAEHIEKGTVECVDSY